MKLVRILKLLNYITEEVTSQDILFLMRTGFIKNNAS
jgi:hypothetical protein